MLISAVGRCIAAHAASSAFLLSELARDRPDRFDNKNSGTAMAKLPEAALARSKAARERPKPPKLKGAHWLSRRWSKVKSYK